MSEVPTVELLARELLDALDDPKRAEWGEGPWEHLGDAERDARLLIAGVLGICDALRAADAVVETYGRIWAKDAKFYAYEDARKSLTLSKQVLR